MIKHKIDLQRKFNIVTTDPENVQIALGDVLAMLVIRHQVQYPVLKKS